MTKELLKGFSLVAIIVMLALMTAAASASGTAPSEDSRALAVSR